MQIVPLVGEIQPEAESAVCADLLA